MIVSGAAPPMVDALRRVRRWMSRRVFCRFCQARSRVPMVFGPFHYCAFCKRAAPDAPETIDDQRRWTGWSLSDNLRRFARERVPTAPAKWLGPITPTVYTNDSTLIETKVSARTASLPAPAEWLGPTSTVPSQRINSNQKLLHGESPYKLRANRFNPRKNRGRFADLMPGG